MRSPKVQVRYSHSEVMIMALEKTLFDKPLNQLTRKRDSLIEANDVAQGVPTRAVRFRGQILTHRDGGFRAQSVHVDLRDRFIAWTKQYEQVMAREKPMAMGYLHRIFPKHPTYQEFLQLLPETLHPVAEKYASGYPEPAKGMGQPAVQAFLEENDRYLQIIKQRMARNLII